MKKLLLILLMAVSIISTSCTRANTPEKEQDIVILFTNDVHCGVDANIGYAKVAAYKKQLLEQNPYVTLVDNGDAVQGDTIGAISKGEDIIGIMNMTPPESAVIASDIAVKSGNVYLGFADRFSGTLIITGEISEVESAIQEIVDYFGGTLGYVTCPITKR